MVRRFSVLRRVCGTMLLLGAVSCATPNEVKEASSEQLVLLDELLRSLRELDAALVKVPQLDAATLADRLERARQDVDPVNVSLAEHLKALADPGVASPPRAERTPGLNEVLCTQVELIASASRVLDRYLQLDVFGDDEVKAMRALIESAQEKLQ